MKIICKLSIARILSDRQTTILTVNMYYSIYEILLSNI